MFYHIQMPFYKPSLTTQTLLYYFFLIYLQGSIAQMTTWQQFLSSLFMSSTLNLDRQNQTKNIFYDDPHTLWLQQFSKGGIRF